MKNNKVSLFDWRFKLAIFFLILVFIFLIISLILFTTAKFENNNDYLGNGFWALNNYSLKNLLLQWEQFDDQAIHLTYSSHDFYQVFIAIIFLLFLLPIFFILVIFLILRWWIKNRI